MTIKSGRFKTPVWIDLITGNVYEIPDEQIVREGNMVLFKDVPVYDGPGVITDGSLLTIEPARENKSSTKTPTKASPAKKDVPAREPKMKTFLLPGTQQPAPAVLIVGRADEAALDMAKWLNEQDVHAFIVKTDESVGPDAALQDARAALDHVRSRAAPWQVKTDAVGIMALGTQKIATVLTVGADADFTVLIATQEEENFDRLPGSKPKSFFVGKKDAWKQPLSVWLEKRKGKLHCIDPDTGRSLEKISVPAAKTTACWCGGEKLDELYITTATVGEDEASLRSHPLAGGLFVCRPGASGHPTIACYCEEEHNGPKTIPGGVGRRDRHSLPP